MIRLCQVYCPPLSRALHGQDSHPRQARDPPRTEDYRGKSHQYQRCLCFTVLYKEKIHFLIQAEAFTLPLVGRLLALADQIPVYVGRGREALDTAKEKLRLGHSVAIFPEERLNDGRSFHRAGAGAALLAFDSGAPLIPLGFYVPPGYARSIRGYFHHRHTVGRWQFGGDLFIRFGDVFEIPASISEKVHYRELRRITEKMMARVAELVQQAQEEAGRLNSWY